MNFLVIRLKKSISLARSATAEGVYYCFTYIFIVN